MKSEVRERLVRQGFEAYANGEVEAAARYYHPDAVITAPDFMNPGPYRGPEGFKAWQAVWMEAWDDHRFDIRGVQAVGERHVVAEVRVMARGTGSGVEVDVLAGWLVEVASDDSETCVYLEIKSSPEAARAEALRREGTDPSGS